MALLGPDLQLDPLTHDLVFVDGALQLVADPVQKVKIRLLFIRGEWFLDIEEGVPYFEEIFVKAPNLDRLRALYRTVIGDTLGIEDVREIDLAFDAGSRRLTLTWTAGTAAGEIDSTVQIP